MIITDWGSTTNPASFQRTASVRRKTSFIFCVRQAALIWLAGTGLGKVILWCIIHDSYEGYRGYVFLPTLLGT